MNYRLRIDGTLFRDPQNRTVILHGINLAGDAKVPATPDLPSHERSKFFDGDNVSFVNRPFDLKSAPEHFSRLRQWGYNTLRYVYTWEALEAAGPGKYDEKFIQHTISVLRVAKSYGFYVIMDPHQDCWSRFTGGCGAPMWTIYACGINPEALLATEAALVQNIWPCPIDFPKMIWATNYNRLACQALFTMFWAGKQFTPKAIIDGMNIQDYLQSHFINACKHLAQRVKEAGDIDHDVVIGWESVNEPNKGLIGSQDISVVPSEQKLRLGTSPTAWQAILTGSGRSCEVETWSFGGMGPYKSGSTLVDPKGKIAWLPANYDDSYYGWKRDPGWKLGQCIWAQHGVWDPKSDALLKEDYFARDPKTGDEIDYEYFTNHYFMDYFRNYKSAIRQVLPNTIMFCQPPTLELPPSIKGTHDEDSNMVYSPHWYDGVTLMNKKWNRFWNVDVFGILRGRYLTPAFAIKIGETAIRNCFRDSVIAMRKEGLDYMGNHPFLLGEFGIPFDMNDSEAYKNGDYTSQIHAMDANLFAVEGSMANFTLWNYTVSNTHKWGDQWYGEDLSIVSKDDPIIPSASFSPSGPNFNRRSPSFSESHASGKPGAQPTEHEDNMQNRSNETDSLMSHTKGDGDLSDFRAAEAYIRPYPSATHGNLTSFTFDLKSCEFILKLSALTATKDNSPTEIFLPTFHFPEGCTEVSISGGKYLIETGGSDSAPHQRLKWWYAAGEQDIRIKGLTKKERLDMSDEEQQSYFERCREKGCTIM